MYTAQKLQSPVILPPEALSQNWVSADNFDLAENLTLSFKIKSNNTSDKELGFGIFLVNTPETDVFGASTIRCGLVDYATKGEVGEAIEHNNDKLVVSYGENEYDLLLDHVYPFQERSLCKNQNPFNTSGFDNVNAVSILFDSTKNFYKEYQDAYKNVYFDEVIVKDLNTGLEVDPQTYSNPVFLQVKQDLFVFNFELEGKALDILNLEAYIIRFSFENYGKLFKLDILEPGSSIYKPMILKYFDLDLKSMKNLKLAYLLSSPLESYDMSKQANFEIQNFHVQGKLQ